MKVKKLIGLLTVFENFLSQLNKKFSSKKLFGKLFENFFYRQLI